MDVEHPIDAYEHDLAHVRELAQAKRHEADCEFANEEITQEKWMERRYEIRLHLELNEGWLRRFYGIED